MHQKILLATDGAASAVGAVRVALDMERQQGAEVQVVAVLTPALPLAGPEIGLLPVSIRCEREHEEGVRAAVQAQLREVTGTPHPWNVDVVVGMAASTIARVAYEEGCTLVVMGIGKHTAAERWLGDEVALHVSRLAPVPVLAVPPTAERRPRSAVVGVDFGDLSLDVADVAAPLLPPRGALHLCHALAPLSDASDPGEATFRQGAQSRLRTLAWTLEARHRIAAQVHLVEGSPAQVILELVEQTGAELLAVGSRGYGFLGRLVMGSVSTRLLRAARCSVLINPPRTLSMELVERGAMSTAAQTSGS